MNKRLLIFSYDYPPSNGGIARLCQEIAAGMHQYYTSITVLTVERTGISKPYNFENVNIVKLPLRRGITELCALWYLLRLKNKNQTDILCGLWHPEAALCLLAGLKNVFILGHGTEFLSGKSGFRKAFWLPYYCRYVLGSVKKIVANSNFTHQLIANINNKANISTLPLAVNHQFFKPDNNKTSDGFLRLVTVSRVLKFKGYDFIAKTIASLPANYKEKIIWNIGGTGAYLPELKELVKNLGLAQQVNFAGFIPDEKLPAFYNEGDVFILCSRAETDSTSVEGFGLVFLEAQACGVPAIGTATGGIPDAIADGNGGWLIKQDNIEQLAILLKSFFEDNGLVKQGTMARRRVEENCTWENYCNQLNSILT